MSDTTDELLLRAMVLAGVSKEKAAALGRALVIAARVDSAEERGTRCIEVPVEIFDQFALADGQEVDWGLPDATGFYSPTLNPATLDNA